MKKEDLKKKHTSWLLEGGKIAALYAKMNKRLDRLTVEYTNRSHLVKDLDSDIVDLESFYNRTESYIDELKEQINILKLKATMAEINLNAMTVLFKEECADNCKLRNELAINDVNHFLKDVKKYATLRDNFLKSLTENI